MNSNLFELNILVSFSDVYLDFPFTVDISDGYYIVQINAQFYA